MAANQFKSVITKRDQGWNAATIQSGGTSPASWIAVVSDHMLFKSMNKPTPTTGASVLASTMNTNGFTPTIQPRHIGTQTRCLTCVIPTWHLRPLMCLVSISRRYAQRQLIVMVHQIFALDTQIMIPMGRLISQMRRLSGRC